MLAAIDVDGSGTVELGEFGCWLFRVQRWGASSGGGSGSAGRKKKSPRAKDKTAKRKSTSAKGEVKVQAKAMADGGATLRDLQALLQASGFGSDATRARNLPSDARAALQSILAAS
jgi:hypothetical protein